MHYIVQLFKSKKTKKCNKGKSPSLFEGFLYRLLIKLSFPTLHLCAFYYATAEQSCLYKVSSTIFSQWFSMRSVQVTIMEDITYVNGANFAKRIDVKLT